MTSPGLANVIKVVVIADIPEEKTTAAEGL
jgi:hypothetical protein